MGEIADYYAEAYYEHMTSNNRMYEDWVDTQRKQVMSLDDVSLVEEIVTSDKEYLNRGVFPAWDVAHKIKTQFLGNMTDKQRKALQNCLVRYRVR